MACFVGLFALTCRLGDARANDTQRDPPAILAQSEATPSAPAVGTTLPEVRVPGRRDAGYVVRESTTATKIDTPLRDVPASVQIVPRQVMEDQAAITVGDALRNVSGVTPQIGFGTINSRYKIRGFVPPSQLMDGFRRNAFIPITDIANVEQIEVLKGPVSALYGRFEPGGIVNIVTKKPTLEPLAAAQIVAGDFSYFRPSFDLSGPLNETRTVLGRINIAYENAGSYRDFMENENIFIAPALEFRFSPDTKLIVQGEYLQRRGGFDRGFGLDRRLLDLPIERNLGEPTDNSHYEGYTAYYVLNHRLNRDWELRHAVMGSRADHELYYFNLNAFPALITGCCTYNRRATRSSDTQQDLTVQFELVGDLKAGAVAHKVLAGVEYVYDYWSFNLRRGPNRPLNMFAPVYGSAPGTLVPFSVGSYKGDTVALYLQDQISLGERWKLLLGGRYDMVDATAANDLTRVTQRRNNSKFTPRAGLTFQPNRTVAVYGSYAEGFRSSEQDGFLAGGGLPAPTEAKQYEIGVKFDLLNGMVLPTFSLYRLIKTNVSVPDPSNPGFVTQVGEQTVRGFEADIAAQPLRNWRVIASYAYADGYISSDTTIPAGNRIFNLPRNSASVWSTYDFTGEWQGWGAGGGVFYVGERAADNANSFFLPSYTRVDATIYRAWDKHRWRLALNVKNIFDKKYFDSGGSFVPLYPQPPRAALLTLGYQHR